jgi:hypothetical protein
MTPAEKRQTWRRITLEDSAWRFNTYAERARETIDAKRAEEAAGLAAEAPAEPAPPAIANAASAPGGARGG